MGPILNSMANLLFQHIFQHKLLSKHNKITLNWKSHGWDKQVMYGSRLSGYNIQTIHSFFLPGHVAQSVMCLATDVCLTADTGVVSSIPARSHTFEEIDREIISMVILLHSTDSFKKGCCQL